MSSVTLAVRRIWARFFGSIRAKALLLLAAVALVPAGIVQFRLAAANGRAIMASEQSLQAAVLAEVAAFVRGEVEGAEDDLSAISQALSLAALRTTSDPMAAVRSLMATRGRIETCRFEVPTAGVDTVLRRTDKAHGAPPRSTPELRAAADLRGVVRALDADGITMVARTDPGEDGVRGYVTAHVSANLLAGGIEASLLNRLEGTDACLIVANEERRVVSSHCRENVARGAPTRDLAVYSLLPDGLPRTAHVGVIGEFSRRGAEFVGGVESIDAVGWSVAMWRPKARAYAALTTLRRETLLVGIATLLLAGVVAVVVAAAITRPVLRLREQAGMIAQRRWQEVRIEAESEDEIGDLARAMSGMVKSLRQGEEEIAREARLRGDLSRFLSRELVDAIVTGKHALALGGKRAEVSVLFADVVGFTPLSEQRPAEQVVALLNELFSMLSEVVFRHGGTVDKFIGDCIMAVWGAPVTQADHAQRALAAAEDMLRFLETANVQWRERFDLEVRLAIGVNSGEVLVGNVGSAKRMEYTVIGDAVNVAARLEAIAKPNQILVGSRTRELVGEGSRLVALGEHRLLGRGSPVEVFNLEFD